LSWTSLSAAAGAAVELDARASRTCPLEEAAAAGEDIEGDALVAVESRHAGGVVPDAVTTAESSESAVAVPLALLAVTTSLTRLPTSAGRSL